MKIKVIIFSENGIRILTNPENISEYKNKENVLINPNFELVKDLSVHDWTIDHFRKKKVSIFKRFILWIKSLF